MSDITVSRPEVVNGHTDEYPTRCDGTVCSTATSRNAYPATG